MNDAEEILTTTPKEMLARSLRRERERVGLSVSELAKRAGISKSTLSQLENGIGNPSLETLWALAMTLEIRFSRLINDEHPRIKLIRAKDSIETVTSASGNYSAELLASAPIGVQRDIYRVRLDPGQPYHSAAHAHGAIEHVILCSGKASFGPDGEEIILYPGDYVSYPADISHTYNALEENTTAVMVMENT